MSDPVHVGDIGIIYRFQVLDDFDVTGATVTQLIFSFPFGQIATRDCSVVEDAGATFFEYQVTSSDVLGSPAEFHHDAGQFFVQSYVGFPDGQTYHSNIVTVDDDDQELRVFPNLG